MKSSDNNWLVATLTGTAATVIGGVALYFLLPREAPSTASPSSMNPAIIVAPPPADPYKPYSSRDTAGWSEISRWKMSYNQIAYVPNQFHHFEFLNNDQGGFKRCAELCEASQQCKGWSYCYDLECQQLFIVPGPALIAANPSCIMGFK